MRTSLISRGVLLVLLSSSTLFCSAQEQGHEAEDHYVNPHITGIGTTQLSYELSDQQQVKDPAALRQYLERINGVLGVNVDNDSIDVTTDNAWNDASIYLIFQGVEIYYLATTEQPSN